MIKFSWFNDLDDFVIFQKGLRKYIKYIIFLLKLYNNLSL